MDLTDFFPSINLPRVISVFSDAGYPPNVSFYLASLCCLEDKMPQGAATSPALSNIVCYRLDRRLFGLSKSYELTYSRYADDLAFSGNHIPLHFPDIVEKIVLSEGFSIRRDKTRLSRSANKRIVTGLSVTGKVLRIPRENKRQLRKELFHITTKGYLSHVKKMRVRNPFYFDSVYGKLTFWLSIEPENHFARKAIEEMDRIREIQLASIRDEE